MTFLYLIRDRIITGIKRTVQNTILQPKEKLCDTPSPIISPGVQHTIIIIISRKHDPPANDENKYRIMRCSLLFIKIHLLLRKVSAKQ